MCPVTAEPAGASGGSDVPQAADRPVGGVDRGAQPPKPHAAPVQPAVWDRTEHGAGGAGAGARAGSFRRIVFDFKIAVKDFVCVSKLSSTCFFLQLRLQLWEAYCEVRSLCSHLRGNDVTDSALSTDSSMDESSETSSAKDVPTGSLHTSLLELRRITQNLLDGNESTVTQHTHGTEQHCQNISSEWRNA